MRCTISARTIAPPRMIADHIQTCQFFNTYSMCISLWKPTGKQFFCDGVFKIQRGCGQLRRAVRTRAGRRIILRPECCEGEREREVHANDKMDPAVASHIRGVSLHLDGYSLMAEASIKDSRAGTNGV